MRTFTLLFFVSALTASFTALGLEPAAQLSLERAARIVASSYASGNPNENLYDGQPGYAPLYPEEIISNEIKIRIKTEHSLDDKIEPTTFIQGFKEYAKWLEAVRDHYRLRDNLDVRTLGACVKGCCEFPATYGISHNTLYLQMACFTMVNNKPYLTSILLLDGD